LHIATQHLDTAQNQVASGSQHVRERLEHTDLRRSVQVDQQVSADNEVRIVRGRSGQDVDQSEFDLRP
jgi:hypothetical protein